MKNIFLTIAIPTFNRCNYLSEQLDRLHPQIRDRSDVEILVCDNASQDRTREIVESKQEKVLNLRYFCHEKNMGFDKNIYKAYENSRGKYIWFLADDDYVVYDAVSLVESVLEKDRPQVLVMGSRQSGQSFTIDPLHQNAKFTEWSFPNAAEHFMAVIMLARLILKKDEIDLANIKSLPDTVFPQVTLALEILKNKFLFVINNSVIINRDPGVFLNNFFDLYLLGVRRAIRYSSWSDAEKVLLPIMENNLHDFVRLQKEERLGYYHSRKGLPLSTWLEGWKVYASNWRNRCELILILIYSIIPRKLFRLGYYLFMSFKKRSFTAAWKILNEYNRSKNINRVSDV